MRRCIRCGKEGEFRLFCSQCYLKEHPLVVGVKTTDVKFCPVCNKLFLKGKWKPVKDIHEAISEMLTEKLSVGRDYKLTALNVKADLGEVEPRQGMRFSVEAKIDITAFSEENNIEIHDQVIVPMDMDLAPCGKCGMGGTQYFEGTLQVRNLKQDMIAKIQEILQREKEAGVHINDTVKVKDGAMDFYITDVHYMKKLGKELQKRFGGELSMSPRLQTRDNLTSKDLYRLNVLLRLSNVKPGDYVVHEGRVIRIKKTGSLIIGRDIIDNTNVKIDPKRSSPKPLEIIKTAVTNVRPAIEAMNPVSFQCMRIENAKKQKLGQKIRVVVANEKMYVVN
jgi:NMD protein affecting ribosome stability and mRNA decay